MKSLFLSLKIFIVFTILTGVIYPLAVTGIAQLLFPYQSNGSIIMNGDKKAGSELIGQSFDTAIYFTSRPSAVDYKALPSGGSNFGLSNPKLKEQVEERRKHFITSNFLEQATPVPSEMLLASASGLDPHISKQAALLQVERIAKARQFSDPQKEHLRRQVSAFTEGRQYGIFGQERVNVLLLNLALDKIK